MKKPVIGLVSITVLAAAAWSTALVYSACTTAVTVDVFQSTWTYLDQKHATGFGPQTPVSDYQTCQPLRITRAPAQVPPNTAVFSSLLALFN